MDKIFKFKKSDLFDAIPLFLLLGILSFNALMPSSFENKLSFYIGSLRVGFFEAIFLFFGTIYLLTSKKNASGYLLVYFSFVILFSGAIGVVYGEFGWLHLITGMLSAFPFFLSSHIQWKLRSIKSSHYILLFIFVVLFLQLLLLSLGIISIETPEGNTLGAEGEISRINTTVGAATGTGSFLMMLGTLLLICVKKIYGENLYFYSVLFCLGISIFLTFSRGSVLSCFVFYFVWYITGVNKKVFYKVIFFVVFCILTFFIFNNQNLLDALLLREGAQSFDNGRFSRFLATIHNWEDNVLLGVGYGGGWVRKYWFSSGNYFNLVSPHNTYLLFLVEIGFLGISIVGFLFFKILKRSYYIDKNVLFSGLLSVFLIGMNLEHIYMEVPFIYIFSLLLSLTNNRNLFNNRLVS